VVAVVVVRLMVLLLVAQVVAVLQAGFLLVRVLALTEQLTEAVVVVEQVLE
jgi:hypothetical protein